MVAHKPMPFKLIIFVKRNGKKRELKAKQKDCDSTEKVYHEYNYNGIIKFLFRSND